MPLYFFDIDCEALKTIRETQEFPDLEQARAFAHGLLDTITSGFDQTSRAQVVIRDQGEKTVDKVMTVGPHSPLHGRA